MELNQITNDCILSFHTSFSPQNIQFVNKQYKNTNSKGDFVLKPLVLNADFKGFWQTKILDTKRR